MAVRGPWRPGERRGGSALWEQLPVDAVAAVTWRQAQIVLLSAQSMDVAAIAKVAFTSEDRVRDVIRNLHRPGRCGACGRGLSVRDVAALLGISPQRVSQHRPGQLTPALAHGAGRTLRRRAARRVKPSGDAVAGLAGGIASRHAGVRRSS